MKPRWRTPIHAPQLVRELFDLMAAHKRSMNALARAAGLGVGSISNWGHSHIPSITNFEAALNALGYRLAIVPIEDDL